MKEYEITNRDGSFINVDCNTKIINTLVRKINELVDAVNALVYEHDKDSDWYDGQTRAENVQPDAESRPENAQKEPITLLDIFNNMGEMYSSLWNKMEDIHHDLKTKGGDNE